MLKEQLRITKSGIGTPVVGGGKMAQKMFVMQEWDWGAFCNMPIIAYAAYFAVQLSTKHLLEVRGAPAILHSELVKSV